MAVAVAVVALFGLLSLGKLPLQLFPDIEYPRMSVNTGWRAASPTEIESEILEPQERVLQGLPGLQVLEANAFPGGSWIGMQFALETDMERMLMEVIGRLNRLPPLPADADPPQVWFGGGDANQALSWFFVQLLPGTPGNIDDYQAQVEEIVKPALEAIPGVAGVAINDGGGGPSGPAEELQITIDPYRAAELGIQLPEVARIAGSMDDVSGGFVDVGRRTYTLRFAGRYSPDQLRELILEWRDGQPVRLGDIADVGVRKAEKTNLAYQNGNPAMGVRVDRESGANVLESLSAVKAEVARLREGPLKNLGLGIEQSFDASVFINRAVNLVRVNLMIGVLLAVGILWWFLRDRRATLLIATAIPLSLLATFVVLQLTGRTLNVISLAGLAFAVGMVLDAAIVVAENIVRLRERGETADAAALLGTRQVQGALLASTATTVAIFLPVLFLEDVEGQLFADLALTIAIAVSMSLLVALTVLPAAAGSWLRAKKLSRRNDPRWASIAQRIMRLTDTPLRRGAWVAALIVGSVGVSWLLFPKMDYLPPVKRDAVDAWLGLPPGQNLETTRSEIIEPIVARLQPYMLGEKEPKLKNYYVQAWPGGGTIGARVQDQSRVKELEEIIRNEVLVDFPDFFGNASQGDLFGGFGGGRDIALHVQSADVEGLYAGAKVGEAKMREVFENANVNVWPALEMSQAEIRVNPNDQRMSEVGWTRRDVAQAVRTLGDGLWLGEYFNGDRRLDIIMRAGGWQNPEDLAGVPVATPSGAVVPFGELADVTRATGPTQIRRVNGRRTITLALRPPDGVSLEESVATVRGQVEPALREALPPDQTVVYGGSADALQQAVGTMAKNFLTAIAILFLLMAGLFRSIKDSAIVVLTVPLAAVGGVVALRGLNLLTPQPMDLLAMIGFIILLGLVVNNAILLVDRTRRAEAEGLSRDAAVEAALKLRLRPIFMSTLTSLFGMLPLVLFPGEGSVIYRGLGTAIVGGMSVSLIFTLVLLPSLLRMGTPAKKAAPPARLDEPPLESVA